MSDKTNRRDFIKTAALTGAGFWVASRTAQAQQSAPASEKLNMAFIGAGGKAGDTLNHFEKLPDVNVYALCDVDEAQAKRSFERFPKAQRFKDYRKMLDEIGKNLDAVVVTTPDHHHAPASVRAMNMGLHCYCEKPLTHTIQEARVMAKIAAEKKLATQMGNQGSAENGLREAVEVMGSNAIGAVKEVHVWTNRPIWPQGTGAILGHSGVQMALHGTTPELEKTAVKPDSVEWDLWLGPAPERPFNRAFLPFKWRGWWDYGTGALGDMACHTANMAFRACKLTAPTSIKAELSEYNPETFSMWSVIEYEFPARGEMPPLKWTWYDGGKDKPAWVLKKIKELAQGEKLSDSGSLIIGEKGTLFSPNDYGAQYKLLPEANFKDYKAPTPTIPRSPGHHREWVDACKGGPAAYSNFVDAAAPLTEVVLLGTIAMRYPGTKLEWDSAAAKFTNKPEADQYVTKEYRKGWEI